MTTMQSALEATKKFTSKEIEYIILVLKNAERECGAKDVDTLLFDNFSWFCHKDLATKYNKNEFAGLVSSTMAKGIVSDCGDGVVSLSVNESFLKEIRATVGNCAW